VRDASGKHSAIAAVANAMTRKATLTISASRIAELAERRHRSATIRDQLGIRACGPLCTMRRLLKSGRYLTAAISRTISVWTFVLLSMPMCEMVGSSARLTLISLPRNPGSVSSDYPHPGA
jgi:hypothetical protein